jgi:hypothetical protein
LTAAALLAGGGFLVGRMTSPRPAPVIVAPPPQQAAPPPANAEPPRILGRTDIIELARKAADGPAGSADDAAPDGALTGRRFDLLLPFGCEASGPASTAPLRWRYDEAAQTLRVHVEPARWDAEDWGIAGVDGKEAKLEGFWIARPWSTNDRCSPADAGREQTGVNSRAEETLAVAELVPESNREKQEERVFQIVRRFAPADLAAMQGLRLRLMGRIASLPPARNVRCRQPGGPEQRPICLVPVAFDELRIEDPASGDVLGTWSL